MSEAYDRCRFWPNCEIHKDWIAPRFFSRRNLAEMFRDWIEGARMEDIARSFGTSRSSVSRAVRNEMKRLRNLNSDLEEASMG